MKKTLIALVAGVVVVSSILFASCGKNDGETTTTTAETTTTVAETTTTVAETSTLAE